MFTTNTSTNLRQNNVAIIERPGSASAKGGIPVVSHTCNIIRRA